MAAQNLNINAAVNLIQNARGDKLQPLLDAANAKLEELGLSANKRLAKAGTGSGGTHAARGILTWIDTLNSTNCTDEDKTLLQTLQATLQFRAAASGHA